MIIFREKLLSLFHGVFCGENFARFYNLAQRKTIIEKVEKKQYRNLQKAVIKKLSKHS